MLTLDQSALRSRNAVYEACTLPLIALRAESSSSTSLACWRGGHQIGREGGKLDAVLAHPRGQRLRVEPLHLGQRVPQLQRDDARAGAVRLVEAGIDAKWMGAIRR